MATNKNQTLISKFTLYTIIALVSIGNLICNVSHCKWNWKNKHFETDTSKFRCSFRYINFILRVLILLMTLFSLLYVCKYSDFVLTITTTTMMLVIIALHLIGFNNPRYIAQSLNAVIKLNKTYGKLSKYL